MRFKVDFIHQQGIFKQLKEKVKAYWEEDKAYLEENKAYCVKYEGYKIEYKASDRTSRKYFTSLCIKTDHLTV